jgi:hypothetical protein
VLFLSPRAVCGGDSPDAPTYSQELAKGNPNYSTTKGPDSGGGTITKTYVTDPNGLKKLVEIYKKNKAGRPFYHWVTYSGPNGSTVNHTFTNTDAGFDSTKEVIDQDGGKTVYVYDWKGEKWRLVSYTKPESNGLRTVLQVVGAGLNIAGGTSIGHGDHKHEGHSSHSTTTHAGCKCHPCTCSPCHCHA